MPTVATRFTSMATAGVGVVINRLRKSPPVQSLEQLLSNSTRPVSALSLNPLFTDETELVMEAGEPVPRLVFDRFINLEESKESTADLKEALDAMYLESEFPFSSEISLPLNSEIVHNRPGVKHVHQAFHLLCNFPEVQNVVASAAADLKVQEAVFENPDVKKFIQSFQTSSDTDEDEDEENVSQVEESKASEIKMTRNPKDFVVKMVKNVLSHFPHLFGSSVVEGSSGSDDKENSTMKGGKFGSGFVQKLRNLKSSVVEMATNIPNYLPNFYGSSSSASESVSGSDHKENSQSSVPGMGTGTSITGLAIMVIMIAVFKRL
ncbi:uncharacterized protein LOC101211780 [Cucumis sativus]|uniref:Uncharacterized protein n=1 Tax=Cucumis sativus TaxID=3659 RepID=A0A0A0L7S7_CUCSA|nr:uncharacterized protein LOC101211780 [Cucumis sativus]KGN56181.1 hypothetical protein Csa_010839 [Cucumis sativus]